MRFRCVTASLISECGDDQLIGLFNATHHAFERPLVLASGPFKPWRIAAVLILWTATILAIATE